MAVPARLPPRVSRRSLPRFFNRYTDQFGHERQKRGFGWPMNYMPTNESSRSRKQRNRPKLPTQEALLAMSEPERQSTLLEELDQRQDEVLAELEELNSRIECLLKDCLQHRAEEDLEDERPAAHADTCRPAA